MIYGHVFVSHVPLQCSSLAVLWSQKDVTSLQFSLDEIVTASNNFSEENKLGEGGFGAVYKVNID